MLFSHPELVRAELSYRQERITEDYRRANRRRNAKKAATPEPAARQEPVRVSFEPQPEADTRRPAA